MLGALDDNDLMKVKIVLIITNVCQSNGWSEADSEGGNVANQQVSVGQLRL